MPINFDSGEFSKSLREQAQYILRNESMDVLQESLNEVVRERLEELAQQELNRLGEEFPEDMGSPVEKLSSLKMHLSNLDIDHRALVKQVLKKEMKKLLKGFVDDHVR